MSRVAPGGFIFVAQAKVQGDPGIDLPIVLNEHAPEVVNWNRNRSAHHFGLIVESTKQEGGPLVAYQGCIRVTERIGRYCRVEEELGGVRYEHGPIAAAIFQACLQVVRSPLLRNFAAECLPFGPLVPIKAAAAEAGSADYQV